MTLDDHPREPVSIEALQCRVAELTQQKSELEKFNRTLIDERDTLRQSLSTSSRLLKASTTGLISLDKAGLIDAINERAVQMLGADEAYLLKKPISLFIAPEDQAVFFISRSRVVAGTLKKPVEIKFRTKDGTAWTARIDARPIAMPDQQLPGLLLAVEDISAYRRVLEALQFKEYYDYLLFSILDDLSVWAASDIDEVISGALAKIGLVSGADRVYVGMFHERKTRLSITHEWLGEGIDRPEAALKDVPLDAFSEVLIQLKQRRTISVADVAALPPLQRAVHEEWLAAGVRSLLFAPLFFGRYLLGVIGCDAVKQKVTWPSETRSLVKCTGSAIVNALLRRQAEEAPAPVRQQILGFVRPSSTPDNETLPEYDGPIEIMTGDTDRTASKDAQWQFETGAPRDPGQVTTVLLSGGQAANLACKNCNHQKRLDISEIRVLGTQLKVTCACGETMFIKVELRQEHRKSVDLPGMFIRSRNDHLNLKSNDWGRVRVCNLSRHGVGFKAPAKTELRVGDRLRLKFTLDNTAGSVIQKEVDVRSVAGGVVGCQFLGQDPCDVTIGFYMLV
jgi:PAS domain S-box-containing protein